MRKQLLASVITAVAAVPAVADIEFSLGSGGLKAKDTERDINFNVGGRIQLDYDNVQTDIGGVKTTERNELFIRRARIFFSGNVDDWSFKAQYNIAEDGQDGGTVEDLYIQYNGWGAPAVVTLGRQRESYGLEELESSKDITILERGPATEAFAPGYSYGLQVAGDFSWGRYQVGVFQNNDSSDADSGKNLSRPSFTGRLVYNPLRTDNAVVHIAGSYSNRDADVQLAGFELGTSVGAFHAQAEYQYGEVVSESAISDNVDNKDGYYIQVAYILTGEHRPYKQGVFKRVKPASEIGAWELAVRYDGGYGKYSDIGLATVEADMVTAGLNWYANNNVRVGLNVAWAEESNTDNQGLETRFRTQFVW